MEPRRFAQAHKDGYAAGVIQCQRQFEAQGFITIENVVSEALMMKLVGEIESALSLQANTRHAMRNFFDHVPAGRELVGEVKRHAILRVLLGDEAFAVRAIYFDKLPGSNWKVAWHQDRTIAVRERIEVPGFGPWSVKQGVTHVEPPVAVLQRMVALRVHLDDCNEDNGPLRVIPGSHQRGRLDAAEIEADQLHGSAHTCHVSRGSVLAMRPLLLHASSIAPRPTHRRVIHLEFADAPLPGGLQWYAQVE